MAPDCHSEEQRICLCAGLALAPVNVISYSLVRWGESRAGRVGATWFPDRSFLRQDDRGGQWKPCRTQDRKSTRLNSSHLVTSYAVFCLKKKTAAVHSCSSKIQTTC